MNIKPWQILTTSLFVLLLGATAEIEIDLSDVGQVALRNSGAKDAQGDFLHGLAQLHNFQYDDAAEDFRNAQKTDPDFALAYWGEALSYTHAIWMQKDAEKALEALNRYAPSPAERQAKAPTEFARDLLGAADILYGPGSKDEQDDLYMAEMAILYAKYPENVEVVSMYALSIMGTAHEGREFALYMEAAAIITQSIETYPGHPGLNHYLIHATDDSIHAPLGLRAAHAYSKIAPNAAHPQHMTSHIFLALGMWDDVIRANVRANELVIANRPEPSMYKFSCGHYTAWLLYGYLQVGKRDNAFEIMNSCHQSILAKAVEDRRRSFYYLWMRALYLSDTGEWGGEVAGMKMEFPFGSSPTLETAFVDTLIPIKLRDLAASEAAFENAKKVATIVSQIWDKEGLPTDHARRKEAKIQIDQLKAQILLLSGENEAALALLRKAVALEMDLPFGYGPPSPPKPSLELLGEVLVELERFEEAKEVLTTALSRTKGKTLVLAALAKAEEGLKSE